MREGIFSGVAVGVVEVAGFAGQQANGVPLLAGQQATGKGIASYITAEIPGSPQVM